MYGKVKLTKKQIKEDKFTTFMLNTKQQVSDSWQYYVIGLVVVILAISAIVFYLDMQEKQALESANVYAKGVLEYRQKNYQNSILTLQSILDDHGNTEAAKDATFLLGNVNLETQNYPEAIRFYEMYISKYASNKLKAAASQAGIATALENQGQYPEAAAAFDKAVKIYSVGPLVGDYHFSAMKNYLLNGDKVSAEPHYNYILENYKGTTTATRAKLLFAEKSK